MELATDEAIFACFDLSICQLIMATKAVTTLVLKRQGNSVHRGNNSRQFRSQFHANRALL